MTRWLVVLMVLGVSACAFDDTEIGPSDPQPDSVGVEADPLEYITIEPSHDLGLDNQVLLPGERFVPGPESEPCQCSTNECLQDWADKNFGCNLCVTLICSGGTQHVCTICDAPSGDGDDNGFNSQNP